MIRELLRERFAPLSTSPKWLTYSDHSMADAVRQAAVERMFREGLLKYSPIRSCHAVPTPAGHRMLQAYREAVR